MDNINPVDNPELFAEDSRSTVVIWAGALLMVIPTTAVALRFYTRLFVLNQVGADDWLSLGALVFALATGVTQCYMTRQGLGHHIGTLPQPDGFKNYMQSFYLSIIWYNTSLMFVKLTFLAQYWRVLVTDKMRRICVIAMVIIGCWSFVRLMMEVFSCNPIQGFWDHSVAAFCMPHLPQWYSNAAGNVITDIAIFILPLPALGQLRLPRTQKIILIGIFCLGFFTCAISIIRIRFLRLSADSTYDNVDASIWSLCELCSGITCACLPTLRPLGPRWISGQLTERTTGRGYTRQGDSDTHRGGPLRDLEPGGNGEGGPKPVSRGNSDSDATYGRSEFELQRALSPDDSESIFGLSDTVAAMGIMGPEQGPRAPESARAAWPATWEGRPRVVTRIESSANTRFESNSRYSSPVIQVRHAAMCKING